MSTHNDNSPSSAQTGSMTLAERLQKALALHQTGQLENAEDLYLSVLREYPQVFDALHLLGAAHLARKNVDKAIPFMEASLVIRPDNESAYNNMGIAFKEQKQFDKAVACYQKLIAINPLDATAFFNLGNAFKEQKKISDSIDCYRQAISLNPKHAEATINLGSLLHAQGKFDEVVDCFNKIIALNPHCAPAHCGLGLALSELDKTTDAIRHFRLSLAIDPKSAEAHINLGNALAKQSNFDEAMACYDTALDLQPGNCDAELNQSMLFLRNGEYKIGWRKYQSRLASGEIEPRKFSQPEWLGDENLSGKSILLHAEQGLGDTLQFVRYAPMVAALGATVYLEVPRSLVALLKSLPGKFQLFALGDPLPPAHFHCSLLSLPLALRTELDTVPGTTPYLFAPPARVTFWSDKLRPHTKPRIGLAWSGNAKYANDRCRSMTLSTLSALWADSRYQFFGIQKDIRNADAELLAATPSIVNLASNLTDFAETASIIANLDLVISVDTSIGHLAGALGKPVWILLPSPADWRWLRDRDDSPWYPNVRLFRQAGDDWEGVVSDLLRSLDLILNLETAIDRSKFR